MFANFYKAKYAASSNKIGPVPRDKINSTKKWAEYTTDIMHLYELLRTASFEDRFVYLNALTVAERKKAWHFRQENFNFDAANIIVQAYKRASAVSKVAPVVAKKSKKHK